MSLTMRLFLLVMIAVLPALAIQGYVELDLRHAREAETRREVLLDARRTTSELGQVREGARQLLLALAELPAVRTRDHTRCATLLDALNLDYPSYSTLAATDRDGRIFCSSDLRAESGAIDPDLRERALDSPDFVVGTYRVDPATGHRVLPFAHRFLGADGAPAGIVVASLSLDWLAQDLEGKLVTPVSSLVIADGAGTVIGAVPSGTAEIGEPLPPPLRGREHATTAGTIEERGADGRPSIVGYLPPALSGTEFFVGSSRSKADLFADIEAATQRGFALMLAGALLAIFAAWLGGRRFIRRPIGELLEAAAQWRAGNYKARTALRDHGSEIGRLGLAFDAMAAALEQREADQRRGREELQAEQRKIRRLVDANLIGVIFADARRITDANDAFLEMTGYSRADLAEGRLLWRRLTPPGSIARDIRACRELLARGECTPYEKELRCKDGSRVAVLLGAAAVDRRQPSWVCFVADVTGRRRAEEELRQLNATLEERVRIRTAELAEANRKLRREIEERERAQAALIHAQKIEAIGQLTSGVAHDFNNLLAAILGNLELASNRVADKRVLKLLASAARAGERGAKLVEDLLAFSRRQHLVLRPLDINELVLGMGDLLARTIGSLVRIETRFAPGLWPAVADAGQIELAILNLAINARDAMPAGGLLAIETANMAAGSLELSPDLAGDFVAVTVRDTGSGMPAEVLERVFEPFFTTKEVGRGSGLGLSMVYGMAKQSGGGVRIESELGRGTEVAIFLPRAEPGSLQLPQDGGHAVAAIAKVTGPAIRILLVDDDRDVREFAAESLLGAGFSVVTAADGPSALVEIEDDPAIALLVVDYAMPAMTGAEVVRRARQLRPYLPAVVITGLAEVAADRLPAGAFEVVTKPFKLADLSAAVHRALVAVEAEDRRKAG